MSIAARREQARGHAQGAEKARTCDSLQSPWLDGVSLRRLMNKLWVAVGMAALAGCRDEQAGPKNRAPVARAPSPVRTLDSAPADLTFRSGGTWANGSIQYLGSKVEPEKPTAGAQVRLAHYFRALKPPPQGWKSNRRAHAGFYIRATGARHSCQQ